MASIITDDDFTNAISQLIEEAGSVEASHPLTTVGSRFIDRVARVVIDEDDNSDITPPTGVLEAALDRWILAQSVQAAVEQVESVSLSQASSIPGWATWTEAQALDWFDTNIGDNLPVANLTAANAVLADMATAQRALVRMVIALRNKNFPNLQE